MSSSGYVNVSVLAVYEASLTWTRNHTSHHWHLDTSLEVVEETLLVLQENQGDFLLELVAAVSRWMFSCLDLLQAV